MIVTEHVSKFYGGHRALDEVSFTIEAGSVVGFLGLNGAGKTTLLKILCGLLIPSTGKIRVQGIDVQQEPRTLRKLVGFLPENPPLYLDMSVRDYLIYVGRLNGIDKQAIKSRCDEVLSSCALDSVADNLVAWLSQGYRQRLGIAQAIIHKPALVILDEPITGLDPQQIVGMRGLIRSLAQQHTVLLSSHILGEISQTCDHIIVLHAGRIVAQGTEADLTSHASAAKLRLVVRGDADKAVHMLNTVAGANNALVISKQNDIATLHVDVDGPQAREALVKALVNADLGVRHIADIETGLESVFLSITANAETTASTQGGVA